jgi:hypothetical protein
MICHDHPMAGVGARRNEIATWRPESKCRMEVGKMDEHKRKHKKTKGK